MALHSALYSFTWGNLLVIGLISGIRLYFSGTQRFIFAARLEYYFWCYTLSKVGTETLHSTHSSIFCSSYLYNVGRVAQSAQRLATGWTLRGSNPGGGEIFHTCPDRPWGPPSLLYNGYRVFPGGKERPGGDADHSPLLVPLLPLWAVRPVQSLGACTRVHFTFTYTILYIRGFTLNVSGN